MTCIVRPELNSAHFFLLMEMHNFDFLHTCIQVLLGVQHLVHRQVAHLDVICQQPPMGRYQNIFNEYFNENSTKRSPTRRVIYISQYFQGSQTFYLSISLARNSENHLVVRLKMENT